MFKIGISKNIFGWNTFFYLDPSHFILRNLNKIYCRHFFNKDKSLNNYIRNFLEILKLPNFKKIAMNSEREIAKIYHNIIGKILLNFLKINMYYILLNCKKKN